MPRSGEYGAQCAATVPLGRMAQVEGVANVVGFLTTSKASYMTGQAVNVTGGLITN